MSEQCNQDVIKAIYEAKRQELLLAYLNPAMKEAFENDSMKAYVYAYYHRICPIKHCSEKNDPFNSAYVVPWATMNALEDKIQSESLKENVLSAQDIITSISSNDVLASDLKKSIYYIYLSGENNDLFERGFAKGVIESHAFDIKLS